VTVATSIPDTPAAAVARRKLQQGGQNPDTLKCCSRSDVSHSRVARIPDTLVALQSLDVRDSQ
jgi:hypothetical protein